MARLLLQALTFYREFSFDRRALLIIAISLGLGLGVAQVPQILEHLPELPRNIFSSGVATGGLAALILNLVLPETKK